MRLENGRLKNLLQICWELNTDNEEREVNGLLSAMRHFQCTKGMIITANQQDLMVHSDWEIEIIPAWKFLSTIA